MQFTSVILLLLLSLSPLRAQPRSQIGTRSQAEIGVVQSHIEKVYYDVEGKTPSGLAAQLVRRGPRASGERFFGLTEWEVNAEYRWKERATSCSVDDLTVHVAVRTHLPRWRAPADAPQSLSGAWRRFLTALDHHEHGHRKLAEEAAEEIRRKLVALRTPTCAHVEARAHREVLAVLNEYERRNRSYDVETEHGRTQGAVWPPGLWQQGTH